jgi:DNA-binding IclR family transcriptional regulator
VVPESRPRVFGNARRTEILELISLLRESYPRELSRLLALPLYSVQRVINELEREGLLATRVIGGTRRVTLNPRFFAISELSALLKKLTDADEDMQHRAASLRRRPRRAGKPL